MDKHSPQGVTQEAFDRLLNWLDADREGAGAKYEHIRRALIETFTHKGCSGADELADVTIQRVMTRVNDIAGSYVGDPALYFFGVAKKVYLEYLRQKKPTPLPLPPLTEEVEEVELRYACLDKCLNELTPDKRELILKYYQEVREVKMDARKQLAEELGITPRTLRARMFHIRSTLGQCIQKCLQEKGQKP